MPFLYTYYLKGIIFYLNLMNDLVTLATLTVKVLRCFY